MAARRSGVNPFMIAAASASDSPDRGTSFLLGPAECLRVPLQQIPRALFSACSMATVAEPLALAFCKRFLQIAHQRCRFLLSGIDLRLIRVALRHLGICFRSMPRMEEGFGSWMLTPRAFISARSGRNSAFKNSSVRCARRLW